MNIFPLLFLFLPLCEIAGFVVIGGRIGLLPTILWLIAAGFAGARLLRVSGGILAGTRRFADFERNGMAQEVFDSLAVSAAAFLLIFPGFVSDVIALFFLAAPLRRLVFRAVAPDAKPPQHDPESRIIDAEYTYIDKE